MGSISAKLPECSCTEKGAVFGRWIQLLTLSETVRTAQESRQRVVTWLGKLDEAELAGLRGAATIGRPCCAAKHAGAG
jgi:hypothetical protein